MKQKLKIKREVIEGGQEMFDVYILSEGVWELLDSFQYIETAREYVKNQKRG